MDYPLALLTLLHLLVPIYWLGGDLGTFLSGRVLRNPAHSPAERLLALKILLNCDMGPRTALIMAFPTGFSLAVAKGWLALPLWAVALAWLAGLGWLAVAWAIHLKHGPAANPYRKADSVIRISALAALTGRMRTTRPNWLRRPAASTTSCASFSTARTIRSG